VEKFCRARQATDDSMVHVHCMLDTDLEYAVLISLVLLQCLHKHDSVLRYMYIAFLINLGKRENSHGATRVECVFV